MVILYLSQQSTEKKKKNEICWAVPDHVLPKQLLELQFLAAFATVLDTSVIRKNARGPFGMVR